MALMVQTTTSVTSAIRPIHGSFERVNTMESGNYKHGTTLVEMLVVVAVIMILAGLTALIATSIDSHSKQKAVKATFSLLDAALEEYRDFAVPSDFPPAGLTPPENCEILYSALSSVPGSREVLEKISEKVIKDKFTPAVDPAAVPGVYEIYDPWGMVLDYRYNSGDSFPKLISAGPDKTFNSGDDITNR